MNLLCFILSDRVIIIINFSVLPLKANGILSLYRSIIRNIILFPYNRGHVIPSPLCSMYVYVLSIILNDANPFECHKSSIISSVYVWLNVSRSSLFNGELIHLKNNRCPWNDLREKLNLLSLCCTEMTFNSVNKQKIIREFVNLGRMHNSGIDFWHFNQN